jgi:hypothetical protein
MRLLSEELSLVDTHLTDQKSKFEDVFLLLLLSIILMICHMLSQVCKQESAACDKAALLSRTIKGLQVTYAASFGNVPHLLTTN